MSDLTRPTLAEANVNRREVLEHAWKNWAPGRVPPRWQDCLEGPDAPSELDWLKYLIETDVEYRVKAGLPALLGEPYFTHPALQILDADGQASLVRWEYQQRWKHGDRARRGEYQTAFPHLAAKLADMQPRWNCQKCRRAANRIENEDAATVVCSGCSESFSITTIFRPRQATDLHSAASNPVEFDSRSYVLFECLGSGGMGEVYRTNDPALQRDLALKVMRRDLVGDRQAERRFVQEARITGMLQHPGIVPVHNLGRFDDGRLYLTMKLIRGRTLQQIVSERRSDREASLPEFISIFEKVCQAVAYAHSRHIVHRDLKPSNVMVGAFGEMQLMDWGLAKRLREVESGSGARQPDSGGGELHHASVDAVIDRDEDRTQPGRVLGTLQYMPPEQARGALDEVDEQADVFALGAVLCFLLTGAPPYEGGDFQRLLDQAQRADLAAAIARVDCCGAHEDLRSLCKDCLQPDRASRPRTASEVARRLAAYQADVQERLRRNEIERAQAEIRTREERRRRRIQLALSGTLFCLLLGLAVGGAWYERERTKRESRAQRQNQDIARALDLADGSLRDLHDRLADPVRVRALLSDLRQWQALVDRAEANWEQARKLSESSADTIDTRLRQRLQEVRSALDASEADRVFAFQLDDIRMRAFESRQGEWDSKQIKREYLEVLNAHGWDVRNGNLVDLGEAIKHSPIRYAIVAALDHWAYAILTASEQDPMLHRVLSTARLADPDPWRDRFRNVGAWMVADEFHAVLKDLKANQHPPELLLNVALVGKYHQADAMKILRQAAAEHPGDFWVSFYLGAMSDDPGEQTSGYRAALALRPDSSLVHNNLGVVLFLKGDRQAAAAHYRSALTLNPQNASAHMHLGLVQHWETNWNAAIDHYQESLRLEPKRGKVHMLLGDTFRAKRDWNLAAKHYQLAIDLHTKSGFLHHGLGLALLELGSRDEAARQFRIATEFRPDLASAWCDWGRLLREQGDLKGALPLLRRGHELKIKSRKTGKDELSAYWLRECERVIEIKSREVLADVDWRAFEKEVPGILRKNQLQDVLPLTWNSPRQAHLVRFAAGQSYRVEASGDFDPYLRIEDANYNHLAANNDRFPPDDKRSQLVFTPAQTGLFRIVITSTRLDAGDYRLRIQQMAAVGKPQVVAGELTATDPKRQGRYYHVHTLPLQAAEYVIAVACKQIDVEVYLLDKTDTPLGRSEPVQPGTPNGSRLDVSPPRPGNYRIMVIAARPARMGDYTLHIQPFEPAKNAK